MCVKHGQLTETITGSSLQNPLMDVTSCATYLIGPGGSPTMIQVSESLLRHETELVHAAPVTSSLESYLFFRDPGKPHYLHYLPNHPQVRIFAQLSNILGTSVYILPHLFNL